MKRHFIIATLLLPFLFSFINNQESKTQGTVVIDVERGMKNISAKN